MVISTTTVDRLREEAGHLLVRQIIDRNDWISDALLDIAAGGRKSWTVPDWDALLEDLEACPLLVSDWLDAQGGN